jgi:hypothetical protein
MMILGLDPKIMQNACKFRTRLGAILPVLGGGSGNQTVRFATRYKAFSLRALRITSENQSKTKFEGCGALRVLGGVVASFFCILWFP